MRRNWRNWRNRPSLAVTNPPLYPPCYAGYAVTVGVRADKGALHPAGQERVPMSTAPDVGFLATLTHVETALAALDRDA